MPVATLEFTLPEEQAELDRALSATEALAALSELGRHVRDRLKHGELSDETRAALEEVRALVPHELLDRVFT